MEDDNTDSNKEDMARTLIQLSGEQNQKSTSRTNKKSTPAQGSSSLSLDDSSDDDDGATIRAIANAMVSSLKTRPEPKIDKMIESITRWVTDVKED